MKFAFIAFVFLHGMIHLFGFAKAFGLAEFDRIHQNISKFHGILWFVAFLLFALTGEALLTEYPYWHWLSVAAVVLSAALIITVWNDAKFGVIPNLIIAFVTLSAFSSEAFNRKIIAEIHGMIQRENNEQVFIIHEKQLERLPYPVSNWLRNSGIAGKEKTHTVWLRQRIKMKLTPAQKDWYDAGAVQFFTIDSPAFLWMVHMEILPLSEITGRDKFIDGKGEMRIRLFSQLDIVNRKGKNIDQGSMQRFLAEIAWFPSAAISPYITWEMIDSLSARATMIYNGTSGSGIFYFNPQGDFVEFRSLRYKDNGPDAKRYEWVVSVKEHSIISGLKIPAKLEVSWVLEGGKWTWLELDIIDIRYNDQEIISEIRNGEPSLYKANSLL